LFDRAGWCAPVSVVVAEPDTGAVGGAAPIGGSMPRRRFALALSAIVAGGLAFRVGYVLLFTRYENGKLYDSFWYGVTANGLQQGQFFRVPFGNAPTAAHPPLTSLLVGSVNFVIGLHPGTTVQRLTIAVLGAGVVLCVGLLGRAVAGPWVGLVAAGLAALAPNFWMPSGIVMSETPSMLFMALILLAVVRCLRSPTLANAALLGVFCAAETLVRAELILFVPCLLVPALLAAREVPLSRRFALIGVGLLATAVVLAPWVIRNQITFQDSTYISTGDGLALLGANCPETYSGGGLGFWSLQCATSVSGPGDESVQSSREQHAAIQFAEHHLTRLPLVMAARIGREWDLYQPIQEADVEVNEGRPLPASLAGLGFYYALLPLGIAGIVMFRRRGIRQWFLLVPAGVVTFVSALVYGLIRFRAPFEVCLVVLAAPPLVMFGQWLGRGRTGASGSTELDSGSSVQDASPSFPTERPPSDQPVVT
jgi:4-amino-4-deoxy-L-arabinose transferase-like glycosyltransferase